MANETKKMLKAFSPKRTNIASIKKNSFEIPNHSRGKEPESERGLTNKDYVDSKFPVTHASTTGQTTDDHHPQTHTILSHDTDTTGAELTSLADNSMVDTLHRHSELSASDGTPDQAVFVDNAGNVGIGTTAPDNKLEIVGTGDILQLVKGSGVGGILFEFEDGNYQSAIRTLESGTAANNYMQFIVSSGISSNVEAMRLQGDGNVGIGTTSPATKLHVSGPITYSNTSAPTTPASAGAIFISSGECWYIGSSGTQTKLANA